MTRGPGIPIATPKEVQADVALEIAIDHSPVRDAYIELAKEEATSPPTSASAEIAPPEFVPVRIPFGDRGYVEHLADRVDWVRPLPKGENRSPVIDGELRVIEKLRVDGEEYFRVIHGTERLVQALAFFEQLRRSGQVLDRSRAMDALAGMLRFETKGKTRDGHATIGVYAGPEGQLNLCLDPVPLGDEQQEVLEASEPARQICTTAEDLQVYLDLCACFLPEEWVPSAGLGALGAHVQLLREGAVLVPHVFNHSTASGLGKTVVSTAFTESLFGRRAVMADALGSEFRFALLIDAGLPLSISEGERLDPSRLGGALKDSAERAQFSKRGTKELGRRNFCSRSILNMTGNTFPFKARPVRIRFLAPRFDEARARERRRPEARRHLDALVPRLRPIGFHLTRSLVDQFPTRELLRAELERTRDELEEAFPSYNWLDARRSQAWALVLIGLRAWATCARSLGLTWPWPTLLGPAEFIHQVVDPVDRATFESEARPVDRFRNWLSVWRATNVATSRQTTFEGGAGERESTVYAVEAKGEGVEFEDGALTVGESKVSGVWVSEGMLDLYDKSQPPEFRFDGIAELARQAADAVGIPRDLVLDLSGRARSRTFTRGGKKRVAFVPDGPEG